MIVVIIWRAPSLLLRLLPAISDKVLPNSPLCSWFHIHPCPRKARNKARGRLERLWTTLSLLQSQHICRRSQRSQPILTCTFPVGKKFTTRQKEIYEIVLDTHQTAVSLMKPDVLYKDVYLKACETLVEGLKSVNLMKGNAAEAVAAGAHAMFFQCGLGHKLGLDVHDMENLGEEYVGYTETLKKSTQFGIKSLRLGRALEKGFVLTVEPGVYIIPTLIDRWKAEKKYMEFINYDVLETYRDFSGIRIEEDLLITEEGARLLGVALPKTVSEIEAIRG